MDPITLGILGGTALFSIGKGVYDSIKAGEHNSKMEKIMASRKPTVTAGPAPQAAPSAPAPAPAAPAPINMTAAAAPTPAPAPYAPPAPTPAPISGPLLAGAAPAPAFGATTPSLQNGLGAAPAPGLPMDALAGATRIPKPIGLQENPWLSNKLFVGGLG